MATMPAAPVIAKPDRTDPRFTWLFDDGYTLGYPAGHATYPGDCAHIVGEVKGPTTLRQHVVAVEAAYDGEQDRTRVSFRYLTREGRAA